MPAHSLLIQADRPGDEAMSDDDETKWLLPTQIPFDELKRRTLEECLFWLLDGHGCSRHRMADWRKGAGADHVDVHWLFGDGMTSD